MATKPEPPMNSVSLELRAIFWEALDHPLGPERQAFLDRACGTDEALRSKVEDLLRAHQDAGDFLEEPASTLTVTLDVFPLPVAEGPGTSIGPYKLLEIIGEGGMGVVYVAEQTEPVRRRVALKVIKPGMDSKQVIARFEAERQALALMDHPNIARVLDGGTTSEGRPFFVMELVRGIPITQYCDREQLSIRDRLDLFVLVCRAVQHAHQKGIIHRDLKPSNILVTVVDGAAVPRVIDFGVAKAIGVSLTEHTIYTGFHQFLGTPLYMSPEQADLASVDVDTRSDIYSLGTLLYELLTGTTPFEKERFRKAAFDEMRRLIREEEPPKPSTRLSSLGESRTTVCANRKSEPRHLDRVTCGELDWIVMKALEKDRRRRYQTVNDFAADVMRHLTDKPVEACPPTRWYRFKKYARRNRAALSTAGLVGTALLVGTVASSWQAWRAWQAEEKATAAELLGEEHLALGFRAIEGQYERVAEQWLGDVRWLPLPRPFLEQSLPFYVRFANEVRPDPTVGRANRRVGEILIQFGRHNEALLFLQRSELVWRALLATVPSNIEYARDLAACYETEASLGQGWSKRLLLFERAIAIREDVARVSGEPSLRKRTRQFASAFRVLGSRIYPRETRRGPPRSRERNPRSAL